MTTIARHVGRLALALVVLATPAMLGGYAAAQTGTYNADTPADPATEAA